ncbi:hypothetical protein GCM10007857_19960 [Bradyrhizobium iriomotense]|uniref:HipA N-terminal subdomain 1 domain-containing protein n=1 Tax=Bradyrhizobium iriomotense TaxID=441950 RepID=A0ABQ6AUS6_9BRAD|nr:hypothetical protein GCM10007857_19960 [Bradyrhizobium iriomotense]
MPAMPERRIPAGKNAVTQTASSRITVSALFFDSQHNGHDLIRLDVTPPFNEMLIRLPKAHRVDDPLPVLTALDPSQYCDAATPLELKWDRLGVLEKWADTPEKVLASWRNEFRFAVEDLEADVPGLRLPQNRRTPCDVELEAVSSSIKPRLRLLLP